MQVSILSRQPARWRPFLLAFGLALAALAGWAGFQGRPAAVLPVQASPFGKLPLLFTPNQGQSPQWVQYEVFGAGTRVAFGSQEIQFTTGAAESGAHSLILRFLGANPDARAVGTDRQAAVINELSGPDREAWIAGRPTFAAVRYDSLYPGISAVYEGREGQLKSTFTVAPGADPQQIRWSYPNAAHVGLDSQNGGLVVRLADGSQVIEQAPAAWQTVNGQRLLVPVSFDLGADGTIQFALGAYDHTRQLVIDPTFAFEVVYNLADFDSGSSIGLDMAGNIFIAGRAYTTNNDVFVAKLSPAGDLLFTTYLSGSQGDFLGGLVVDPQGDVLLAGLTDSADFPTANALQPALNYRREAFLTKLSGQDGSLLFSTFLGGSRSDSAYGITLGPDGDIYLVGETDSPDFYTLNPLQPGLTLTQCFCSDAFVLRLSPDGQNIRYGTFLGGELDDTGRAIGVDAAGNIYLAGQTASRSFPLAGPIQSAYAGGYSDLFVARISADGSQLDYSTYLGGVESDTLWAAEADGAGGFYLTGSTQSADFPTTPGSYQESFVGATCGSGTFDPFHNCPDGFVTKVLPDGSGLAYSTFLGGTGEDETRDIALDGSGAAHIVGFTNSSDFPPGSEESASGIFALGLDGSGSNLLYAVKVFSASYNQGHGIALDADGAAYITGAQNAPSDLYAAKIVVDGSAPAPTQTATTVAPSPTPTATAAPADPTPTAVPSPTPTATATADPTGPMDVHIADLDSGGVWKNGPDWYAAVVVTVHDAGHQPIANAVVTGVWSEGSIQQATCTTDTSGVCTIESGGISLRRKQAAFTVGSIDLNGYRYADSANHDPDGDSNGKRIAFTRP